MRYIVSFLFLTVVLFITSSSLVHAQYPTYSISGYVFSDLNINQILDSGEPILHTSGTPFSVTINPNYPVTHPSTGRSYQIDALMQGTYTVYLNTVPAGYIPFYPNNGPSPFHTVSVGSPCITDTAHGSSCSLGSINVLNFALRRVHIISGKVYQDVNRNGSYFAGTDTPLWSQTVTITNTSGTPISACSGLPSCSCVGATCTNVTDASGDYTFGPLFTGTYNVNYTQPAGFNITEPASVPAVVNIL